MIAPLSFALAVVGFVLWLRLRSREKHDREWLEHTLAQMKTMVNRSDQQLAKTGYFELNEEVNKVNNRLKSYAKNKVKALMLAVILFVAGVVFVVMRALN